MFKKIVLLISLLIAIPVAGFAQSQNPAFGMSGKDLEKFNAMSPAERANTVNQASQKWSGMGTEEQQSLKDQAVSQFQGLNAQEQEQMKAQALQQWQNMTPEQQQELRNMFPGMLQGSLNTK